MAALATTFADLPKLLSGSRAVAVIAGPPLVLGLLGGVGAYVFEEKIKDWAINSPWMLPLLGAMAGVGVGLFIKI